MNEHKKHEAALREKDQKTSRDWHERNGIPVSVERIGWENTARYVEWISGAARGDGIKRK